MTSSPRTWGCFPKRIQLRSTHHVFPTHVGVFPATGHSPAAPRRLPHARGGVSDCNAIYTTLCRSSPRTWGCFQAAVALMVWTLVFPTHVGVFLPDICKCLGKSSLPHARGGVSAGSTLAGIPFTSSPRTWGCFQGAVEEEDTDQRLPHARGGVSCEGSTSIGVLESSLHMWDLAISGILALE